MYCSSALIQQQQPHIAITAMLKYSNYTCNIIQLAITNHTYNNENNTHKEIAITNVTTAITHTVIATIHTAVAIT